MELRGGQSTFAKKGVVADCCAAKAKGPAKEWARRFGLNQMVSLAFARHTEDSAARLCLEWCRRMQHFYNLWVAKGDTQAQYTEAELASYQADPAWTELVGKLPHGATKERALVIDRMVPRLTPLA